MILIASEAVLALVIPNNIVANAKWVIIFFIDKISFLLLRHQILSNMIYADNRSLCQHIVQCCVPLINQLKAGFNIKVLIEFE